MKVLVGVLAVAATLLVQPVVAAPRDFRPGLQAQERRVPQRQAPREREVERERERRVVPADGAERRQGRLTDEERRDLRRDVDRANRELYRRRQER